MCVFAFCTGLTNRSVHNPSDLSLAHFYIKVFHETVLFTNEFFSPLNAKRVVSIDWKLSEIFFEILKQTFLSSSLPCASYPGHISSLLYFNAFENTFMCILRVREPITTKTYFIMVNCAQNSTFKEALNSVSCLGVDLFKSKCRIGGIPRFPSNYATFRCWVFL